MTHRFIDHGVAVDAAESRGIVTVRTADGHCRVIGCSHDRGPRGWILVTDIDTGHSTQIDYPDGVANRPPFASLLSRNGRFYTGAGNVLLEFDPETLEWRHACIPRADAACFVGEALVDGPGGLIFGGTCYNSHLFSFDPASRRTVDYGRMDPEEQYFWYLAYDEPGWIYCGIGTARQNIVAFHPATGERRALLPESERPLGTARVYRGVDGQVYGQAGEHWYRLANGTAEPIAAAAAADKALSGEIGWGQKTGVFPDGRRVTAYDLPERWLTIENPATGETSRIALDYRSGGAGITTLATGPGGDLYGSTAHPMHLFVFSRARQRLEDRGPHKEIRGGNICAMDTQGPYLVCPAYSKGWFYLYDTTQPWNGGFVEPANPRLLAMYPEAICRPRAALAHPDGRHVMMAGYAGYGLCGGGMAIHDLPTGTNELIPHERLVPNQSVIALKALPDGTLVGGTTIEARGGGHAVGKEAQLFLMDWPARRVTFQTAPVPGAESIISLQIGRDGAVYGLTVPGPDFFVFDPASRTVRHHHRWSELGEPARHPLILAPDGRLFGLFAKAIVRIEPETGRPDILAEPPATDELFAGGGVVDDRLFFAIGAHVWSCAL